VTFAFVTRSLDLLTSTADVVGRPKATASAGFRRYTTPPAPRSADGGGIFRVQNSRMLVLAAACDELCDRQVVGSQATIQCNQHRDMSRRAARMSFSMFWDLGVGLHQRIRVLATKTCNFEGIQEASFSF
jgi:hypothetical protein